MGIEHTRRRLLAYLPGLAVATTCERGAAEDLPVCETEKQIGNWAIVANDVHQTYNALHVTAVSRGQPIATDKYFLDVVSDGKSVVRFIDDAIPQTAVFSLTLMADGVVVAKKTAKNAKGKDDLGLPDFYLDIQDWLAAPAQGQAPSVLSRSKSITIIVDYKEQAILTQTFDTSGIAQAYAWGGAETARLAAELNAKRCTPKDCFLTTVCCAAVGRPDDCYELATLRRFRDTSLARLPSGGAAIRRYYSIAPKIVAEVESRRDQRWLRSLYVTHIVPSVFCARWGFDRAALAIYLAMMRKLRQRYLTG